jgi:membrane associated rhomboid family serine protease
MSIHDRDYYRDGPGPEVFYEAPRPTGLSITAWLIIINVAVFVFTLIVFGLRDSPLPDFLRDTFYTWANHKFRPWQLLTGTFFHSVQGFWHILFNMWILWVFGKGLEQLLGRRDFLTFYLLAGVLASLCFVVWAQAGGTGDVPAIGASGAVMGVVVLFAFLRPRQVFLLFGVFPLQVRWIAGFAVAADLLMLYTTPQSNIAHCAHLGGALFGVIYRYVDLRWERLLRLWRRLRRRGRGATGPHRIPDIPPPDADAGEKDAVDRRVDELLNKISRGGLGSLTDDERKFLKDASRRYGGR